MADRADTDAARWWRATITPLYTRLAAQYPALFPRSLDADGARTGTGASVVPSTLAGAGEVAPASPTAFRDGACSVRTPMPHRAVASHHRPTGESA